MLLRKARDVKLARAMSVAVSSPPASGVATVRCGATPSYAWVGSKREILVFRAPRSAVAAWVACDAICPHMGARLEYDRRREVVRCPWHPLRFALGVEDGVTTLTSDHPRYNRLRTYRVRPGNDDDEVRVEVGDVAIHVQDGHPKS